MENYNGIQDPKEAYAAGVEHGYFLTEQRIGKLLETELTRLSGIIDKGEYFDIPRIQFAMQIIMNLLNEIKGENK